MDVHLSLATEANRIKLS